MAKGACSNCGREATDLLKCTGACGGEVVYCNRRCQKNDWKLHKKICPRPRGGSAAQPLTFLMPPVNGQPEVPLRAVHRMDGHGNSGVLLCFSDHLGTDKLVPFADQVYGYWDSEEDERRDLLDAMVGGDDSYQYEIVTTPVDPTIMKLKPGEAAFNNDKCPDSVNALTSKGIITDTGKRVNIGYYRDLPICRIHAPQTDKRDPDTARRESKAREESFKAMLQSMGGTVL
ncbi:hypothetical protein ACHAWF_016313 [Thalassiosira exigua]